jgi:hypothetical protein
MKTTKRTTNKTNPNPGEDVQVIGSPFKAMFGGKPTYRAMTLDDIEDDCPLCQANRARILAGDPPMAYVYD